MVLLLQQGHTKKPKQGDQREKYCLLFLPFQCVVSKQYNIGRISSINCQKTKHSPWQKAEVRRSHWRRDIQKFLLSLWQFYLPTYCRGKLKNSEFASAFSCPRTSHLNFEDWVCKVLVIFIHEIWSLRLLSYIQVISEIFWWPKFLSLSWK